MNEASSEYRVASSEHADVALRVSAGTPFFNSPERVRALRSAAAAWIGTPFAWGGAVRGHGASCQRLAGAVLAEAGLSLPPVPERGQLPRSQFIPTMRAWIAEHPERFSEVWDSTRNPQSAICNLQPGDLLLCNPGCGHIALYLGGPGAEALQVLLRVPAHCVSLNDPQARKFLLAAWRPIA